MNKIASYGYDWVINRLQSHCDEQGIGYTEDDLAYDLIHNMAEGFERNFRHYLEEGAQHLEFNLMPGLNQYLKERRYDLVALLSLSDDDPALEDPTLRANIETWFDRCLGTGALTYDFDSSYWELADNEDNE